MAVVKLLDDVDANATSEAIIGRGGIAKVFVNATSFGGGTVKLQASPSPGESSEWYDDDNLSFTAKGYAAVQLKEGVSYRAALTGATGASAVRCWVVYESNKKLAI